MGPDLYVSHLLIVFIIRLFLHCVIYLSIPLLFTIFLPQCGDDDDDDDDDDIR